MFRYSVIVVFAVLPSCTVKRVDRQVNSLQVTQVAVYDCRVLAGVATERKVKEIESENDVEEIVQFLSQYETGWTPLRVTTPAGLLRIDYVANADTDEAKRIIAQFRLTTHSIITFLDGVPHSRELTLPDRNRICQMIGLDKSFFLEPVGSPN